MYVQRKVNVYIHAYITLHYITLHYITLHYYTKIHTYIKLYIYKHVMLTCLLFDNSLLVLFPNFFDIVTVFHVRDSQQGPALENPQNRHQPERS